ncbi:Uncharacterised protein [Salmonella enterica subsp. enterica]|nr:Uncharacterised protein [Salmonella enterica subsp. enterica] [Salmonella enterica subsp. enterica serovar Menston]
MAGFWLWFPCEITGELIYNKKQWHFSINAAATAEWSDGKETIYWGVLQGKNVMTCLYFHIQAEVI